MFPTFSLKSGLSQIITLIINFVITTTTRVTSREIQYMGGGRGESEGEEFDLILGKSLVVPSMGNRCVLKRVCMAILFFIW